MAHAKRSSIGSQLPLPTTIALPDSPTTPSFTPSTPTTVGVHLPQGTTFTGTHPLPLNASNIQLHNNQFPTHHSSTHAGGIQPSSSFFKPKRPSEYDQPRYPTLRTPNDLLEDEDEDEEVFKHTEKPGSGQLAIPHPLSPAFSTGTLSPSLSQHQHHHSNHSLEDLKQHEDRGLPPSDTEDADHHRRTVNPKLSREPLIDSGNAGAGLVLTIPGTPSRVHPTPISTLSIGGNNNFNTPNSSRNKPVLTIGPASSAAPASASSSRFGLMRTVFGSNNSGGSPTPPLSVSSRRDSQELTGKALNRGSLDMSINTKKTKRNSFVYKPRLTFESLRRSSLSKDDASRRESYHGTTEDESLNLPHNRHHPFSEVGDGIPLTPTKSTAGARKVKGHHDRGRSDSGTPKKHRTRTKRMSFAASTNASSRSRSRSPSTSISVDEDDSSLEDAGVSTPTPGLFNPTPPTLARGEQPKMKTPLRHPLDPSLLPTDKLERELDLRTKRMKRKRKGGLADKVFGKMQDQPGLPTSGGSPPSSTRSPSKKNLRHIVDIEDKASDSGKEVEGRLARRFELHPSRNRFYFGGRVMTGGDSPWAFVMSLCLFFGLAGVWFGTTGVWWWREAGRTRASISLGEPYPVGLDIDLARRPAVVAGIEGRDWTWVIVNASAKRAGKAIVIVCAYLAAIVISSMLVTAFSDPGILPRGLDPDPPYPANSPSDGAVRAPMPRDLKVRNDVVRVKYCPTCKIYRPPRASHCKMCDNCVDGCDHHCQWVNNCVGRRNYTTFFVLLMSATLTLILIIITSALHLYYLTVWQGYDFKGALGRGAGSAVGFCLSILVIWPVGALLSYHLRLLLLNITTIEQIRNQAHKTLVPGPPPPNPFSHGSWRKNFIAVLCRPQTLSWLDASAVATEDRRAVNPGLLGNLGHSTQDVNGGLPERERESRSDDHDEWGGAAAVTSRKRAEAEGY